ncbi:FbpB family small basic protein [Peribacillus kribbensis]|nr:FbpB family small basic protein [Peribacillus kribbensis]
MKRRRKLSFEELIKENKLELMKDAKALERIEQRLESRHLDKAE